MFISFDQYVEQYQSKQIALFHALRDAIVSGKLKWDQKLPSTRALAEQYELSRGTVNTVYEMLVSQGYLYTKAGSGTFVCNINAHSKELEPAYQPLTLSAWGNRVMSLSKQALIGHVDTIVNDRIETSSGNPLEFIEFSMAKVDLQHFPYKEWNRCLNEQTRQQYQYELQDAYASDGHYRLKQSIARLIRNDRGINVDEEDIVIVNGSQQAITLIVQLLMNEGDYTVMEDPHYVGTRNAIYSVGGHIDVFPVDEHGIVFKPEQTNYKLMVLTPSRQFPTGSVLSMKRRLELLQWAQQQDAFIIEDDYDSEFSHVGRAVEPLKSLDYGDRVIYIGTFSRTMMQNIRIGYAILPKRLREPFRLAKMVYERHPSAIIQQRALASFMESGQYDRHLRRVKRLYRGRAELIQKLMGMHFNEVFDIVPTQAGLHIYAKWKKEKMLFARFLEACKAHAVKVIDASIYSLNIEQPAICLGYAHLSDEQIEEGIKRLCLAWDNVSGEYEQ